MLSLAGNTNKDPDVFIFPFDDVDLSPDSLAPLKKKIEENANSLRRLQESVDSLQEEVQKSNNFHTTVLMEIRGITELLLSRQLPDNFDRGNVNKRLQFPIRTLQEIDTIECLLKEDENLSKDYKSFISVMGGTSARNEITRILKNILVNTVACQCSWKGQKNNKRLGDLSLMTTIRDFIVDRWKSTEQEVERMISDWLRYSGQRIKRQENTNAE